MQTLFQNKLGKTIWHVKNRIHHCAKNELFKELNNCHIIKLPHNCHLENQSWKKWDILKVTRISIKFFLFLANIKHPFPSSLFSLFPPPGIFTYTNENFYQKLRKDLKISLNVCLQIFWCLFSRSCVPSYIPREFIKSRHKYEGYSTRGIMHQLQRTFTENLYWAKQ